MQEAVFPGARHPRRNDVGDSLSRKAYNADGVTYLAGVANSSSLPFQVNLR